LTDDKKEEEVPGAIAGTPLACPCKGTNRRTTVKKRQNGRRPFALTGVSSFSSDGQKQGRTSNRPSKVESPEGKEDH